jgi:hypothetical protein
MFQAVLPLCWRSNDGLFLGWLNLAYSLIRQVKRGLFCQANECKIHVTKKQAFTVSCCLFIKSRPCNYAGLRVALCWQHQLRFCFLLLVKVKQGQIRARFMKLYFGFVLAGFRLGAGEPLSGPVCLCKRLVSLGCVLVWLATLEPRSRRLAVRR